MTPEQEADIRAKARRWHELRAALGHASMSNTPHDAEQRAIASEEYAVLQVEAERAYLALRAAQEAAAKEGTTP